MKSKTRTILIPSAMALVLGASLIAVPSKAIASDRVLQVVAVQVEPGELDTYLGKIKQLNEITKRLGTQGTTRVWRATLAGDATGTVVVGLEFPSLAAFAETSKKLQADAEWQKLIDSLAGIRTLVSQSLYEEISP